MEDENGLELSLGLSFGGSGKSKNSAVHSDPAADEGSSSRLAGSNMNTSDVSLKNFFETGTENLNRDAKFNSDQTSRQHETFLKDLGKSPAPAADVSNDVHNTLSRLSRHQDLWMSKNITNDAEEEKSVPSKRKLPFEDVSLRKKLDKAVDYVDAHGKITAGNTSVRNSHVSLTTEDGSFGENEDVAESEAEGSNSWMVPQREESSRSSDIPKYTDKHVVTDTPGLGSEGQKHPVSGNESNYENGKVAFGIPLSRQPLTVMTVPYPVPAKVPNTVTASDAAGYPSPCVMQLMPLVNSEHPGVQRMNTSSLPLAFGYCPLQLPTLDTHSSWAFSSQPSLVSSFASRGNVDGAPNSELPEADAKIPHVTLASNLAKGSGGEAGTSTTQNENEVNANNITFKPREAAEGLSHEGSLIRPGIASNLKFGGCGSYPDLPWVSTTGTGPNGKTISGVTYKYSTTEIKIVCACHGSHMSPEEFVQHASEDGPNLETKTI